MHSTGQLPPDGLARVAGHVADLTEARRLHTAGFALCKLAPFKKQPDGEGWNVHPADGIDAAATGYGVLLKRNGLASVDPDRLEESQAVMRSLGFDLEAIMEAGARTKSTRPGSGGRSVFADPGGVAWLRFSFEGLGTVLELRAQSANLQDVVPGLLYADKTGELRTQTFANERRIDDRCALPADLVAWWRRCSADLEFLREQQRIAGDAIGARPLRAVSSDGGKLAYASPHRADFNAARDAEQILLQHGYEKRGKRLKALNSEGSPGIRRIKGKDGLWQSDHASDPLFGTFDAWTAFVVLDHLDHLEAAEAAFEPARLAANAQVFPDLDAEVRAGVLAEIEAADLVGLEPDELAATIADKMLQVKLAEATTRDILERVAAHSAPAAERLRVQLGMAGSAAAPPERPFRIKPAAVDVTALRPVRWVITGWVAAGEVFTFAGLPGVGKSTATAALALVAAGYGKAIGSNVPCDRPRRVGIVSEDSSQYSRLLFAMIDAHKLDAQAVARDVPLFDTARLQRAEVRREFAHLVHELTNDEPPLVILDTASASFDLSDENANAEVAAVLAALKPVVTETGAAVWIISHAAKAFSREDSELTPRGAGAWMGDVHGTGSVFQDKTARDSIFIRTLKNRAAVDFREIECVTRLDRHEVVDERGVVQNIGIRIATPTIPFVERAERQAAARDDERREEATRARRLVAEFMRAAGPAGTFEGRPITGRVLERGDVRGEVPRELVRDAIAALLNDGVLDYAPVSRSDGKGARQRLVLVDPDWQEADE